MRDIVERIGGSVVVRLPARVDSSNASDLEPVLLAALSGGSGRMVLDFAELDYISSAGLRVVLTLAKKAKAAQGRFSICALRPHVREVFDISGFLAILVVHPDRAAALDYVAG